MGKKGSEPVEILAETPQESVEQTKAEPTFSCYIGPTIPRLIQHGTLYRGTRAEVLEAAKDVLAARPLVRTLLVSAEALPAARLAVKQPGNALYQTAQKLLKEGT